MTDVSVIGMWSIIIAGVTIAVGSIGPALGEARALAEALSGIARQPDEAATLTRTLFVGMAMVESTAIYCLLVSLILIFANPFWKHVIDVAAKAANAGG
ncbi:MAG TPA: F0F1 ATP synthase subunit C [Planctomycetota bacterium]|nr:F0F1 ATP synthase subunit C [Planctomycetota bacterium]